MIFLRSSVVWFLKNDSTVSDLSIISFYPILFISNMLSINLSSLSNFYIKAYGLLFIKI